MKILKHWQTTHAMSKVTNIDSYLSILNILPETSFTLLYVILKTVKHH